MRFLSASRVYHVRQCTLLHLLTPAVVLHYNHMLVYAEQATEAAEAAATVSEGIVLSGTEGLVIFSIVVNVIIFAFGYGKLSNEVKNLKSMILGIKKDLTNRMDRQGEKIDRVAEGLARLQGTVTALETQVATRQSSPITLTKRGEEIFRDSGGDTALHDLFEELYPQFEGVTNAYDIQRRAKQVIESLLDEKSDKLDRVKDYLYSGDSNFKTVVDVLGIELRDMVFERRGMPVKKRPEEPEPSVVRDEG